jgi:hypothetical protein
VEKFIGDGVMAIWGTRWPRRTMPSAPCARRSISSRPSRRSLGGSLAYLTSESILNIGRYIEMMITPTIMPTMIIISGSTIDVSDEIEASTSSS